MNVSSWALDENGEDRLNPTTRRTDLESVMDAGYKIALDRWGGTALIDHWTEYMQESGNFEDIGQNERILPLGPWKEGMDGNARILSEIMRQNLLMMIPAYKPTLLLEGYDEAAADKMVEGATRELSELSVKASAQWETAWGTRSANDWNPLEVKEDA